MFCGVYLHGAATRVAASLTPACCHDLQLTSAWPWELSLKPWGCLSVSTSSWWFFSVISRLFAALHKVSRGFLFPAAVALKLTVWFFSLLPVSLWKLCTICTDCCFLALRCPVMLLWWNIGLSKWINEGLMALKWRFLAFFFFSWLHSQHLRSINVVFRWLIKFWR